MKEVKEIKNFQIPKDCIINDYFVDCSDSNQVRLEYCRKNCRYKCLNDKTYKKIKK